jgi:hypothetical protein
LAVLRAAVGFPGRRHERDQHSALRRALVAPLRHAIEPDRRFRRVTAEPLDEPAIGVALRLGAGFFDQVENGEDRWLARVFGPHDDLIISGGLVGRRRLGGVPGSQRVAAHGRSPLDRAVEVTGMHAGQEIRESIASPLHAARAASVR